MLTYPILQRFRQLTSYLVPICSFLHHEALLVTCVVIMRKCLSLHMVAYDCNIAIHILFISVCTTFDPENRMPVACTLLYHVKGTNFQTNLHHNFGFSRFSLACFLNHCICKKLDVYRQQSRYVWGNLTGRAFCLGIQPNRILVRSVVVQFQL